ncbi:MAG: hypothetical protein QOD56_854, partial [Gammaproteobacteria bacterium]|nr:hypothetical protein [Gammaproteobacteria bacterium]
MLNRALVLATVMLLIGCFAAAPVHAQVTNLEAGKSPSQIFAGTCTVCHKSPRGLLKTMPAGSLPGFLRQHYTTSPEMAGLLSSYLVSNGAADTRYQGKPGKDAKSDGKPEGKPGSAPEQLDRQGRPIHAAAPSREPATEPQHTAKPDADGVSPQDEGGRKGRKRLVRPAEEGAKPADGETAAREVGERGPDGRKLTAKQRLSKRGKPGEEMPKGDAKGDAAKTDAKTDSGKEEPAASTATKEDKPAGEAMKDEGAKPSEEGKSESTKSESAKSETAKIEPPKETAPKAPAGQTPALRADPVPPVTPAPSAPAASAAVSSGTPEPAAGSSAPSATPAAPAAAAPAAASVPPPAQSEPAPAPVAASAPLPAPSGPPEP